MIADDYVDAERVGVGHFLDRFDAAVQDDHQFDPRGGRVVYATLREAVALVVAVGDIVADVGAVMAQETVDHRHGRAAVHVIVAEHENALAAAYHTVDGVDGHVHVVHQKRVVQIGELWMKEFLGFRDICNTAVLQQTREDRVNTQLPAELAGRFLFLGRGRRVFPFVVHYIVSFYSVFMCGSVRRANASGTTMPNLVRKITYFSDTVYGERAKFPYFSALRPLPVSPRLWYGYFD